MDTAVDRATGKRAGFGTVTPYVTVPAIDDFVKFATAVFGAEETYRARGSAGGFHVELAIGTSMLMAGGGGSYAGPGKPAALHAAVANCDDSYRKALAAGAAPVEAPNDKPYGERQASVTDPTGNLWFLGTPLPGAPKMEGIRTITPFLLKKAPEDVLRFLTHGLSAREGMVHRTPDGAFVFASLWVGDSAIELGPGDFGPSAFYLYVPDAEAVYQKAVEAGAKGVQTPTEQHGDRMGTVEDAWGTTWYIGTYLGNEA